MSETTDYVLNPLPGSVQIDAAIFTVQQAGGPTANDPGSVIYGVAGDLTGDGWPEVVISGWTYRGWDATGQPPASPFMIVSTGPDGPTRIDPTALLGTAGSGGAAMLRIADFTGDGHVDLMVTAHNESPFWPTQSYLYAGDEAGGYAPRAVGPKVTTHEGEVGDVNGDGAPDMVWSAYTVQQGALPDVFYSGNDGNWLWGRGENQGALMLEVNNGDGTFTSLPLASDALASEMRASAQPWTVTIWGSGSASAIGDLDGDGKAEVVVADLSNADNDWTGGDTYLITDIRLGPENAAGTLIKLPDPYFERPEFADLPSLFGGQQSHDIQVQLFDFDNDGRLDVLVHSMVWVDHGLGAGITQFLHNDGGLNFTDVTDQVLYDHYVGMGEGSHESVLMDVNGDGFIDIVNAGEGAYSDEVQRDFGGSWVTHDRTWSNEVLINTGNGKFVAGMWDQFHQLTLKQDPLLGQTQHNLADGRYFPYMTPDGRLGFVTTQDGADGRHLFVAEAEARIYTGPGGANPALSGAPGFNEAYYLTEHPEVAAAVSAGAYASGLAHYLAVGKAQGWAGFAAGAQVEGSDGADLIVLREGDEQALGGAGNDVIQGMGGYDTLRGGAGDDSLDGGEGASYLRGDEGNDTITGGSAFDDINGNQGDDVLHGGAGDDWVVGGKDDDLQYGEAGGDVVWGNLGNDTLDGGDGNDQVRGGKGDDVLTGGAGDDYLSGDKGADTLTGGAGADRFHTFGDAGIDRVTDFDAAEGDRVMIDPGTTYSVAQQGADVVISMGGGGEMTLVGVQLSGLADGWIFQSWT